MVAYTKYKHAKLELTYPCSLQILFRIVVFGGKIVMAFGGIKFYA